MLAGLVFTAEFIALYDSLRWTTAARATVFIYSAPFFVALGAVLFLPNERLRPLQWLGLALAFLGVVVGLSAGAGRRTRSATRWRIRRGALGRDDDRDQGDAASLRRPDEDAALSDRRRVVIAALRALPSASLARACLALRRGALL